MMQIGQESQETDDKSTYMECGAEDILTNQSESESQSVFQNMVGNIIVKAINALRHA